MFTHPAEVVRALKRYRDCYDPRSTSFMSTGGASDPHGEPFHAGFIANFDERAELELRLKRLDARERNLLILWHVVGHPVAHIARMLQVSRVHCYRLQGRALEAMVDAVEQAHAQPALAGA